MCIHHLAVNLSGPTESKVLYGKQYLKVPITLIVPGVLNGSAGPIFYPPEEIQKDVSIWNHMPIVIGHPQVNNEYVSARTPEILDQYAVGFITNTKINEKGHLVSEGWFEISRLEKLSPIILNSLRNQQPIEVSTGLHLDAVPSSGEVNGVTFKIRASNFRPDHLAILIDQKGACSINDGCGIFTNEEKEEAMKTQIEFLINNSAVWTEDHKEALEALSDETLNNLVEDIKTNQTVMNALKEGYSSDEVLVGWNEKDCKFEVVVNQKKEQTPPETITNESNEEESKPMNFQEWITTAPPEVQSVVNRALKLENDQKEQAIQIIIANENNKFSKEQLQAFDIEVLNNLVELAQVKVVEKPAAFYVGSAGGSITNNSDKEDSKPLVVPSLIESN